MDKFNDVERLAIAQAFYSEAGKLVSTKDPASLRSQVDKGYYELYERTGSKSFDVMLNGSQVGTYSLRFSKPTEEKTQDVFTVGDYVELAKWFETMDAETLKEYVASDLGQFAEWLFNTTGEIADGCFIDHVITPATEKRYMGGTLKVSTESVQDALVDMLPHGINGLLGGGDEAGRD